MRALGTVVGLTIVTILGGRALAEPTASDTDATVTWLAQQAGGTPGADPAAQVSVASVPGTTIELAYLHNSRKWCGTGGCTLFIVRRDGAGRRLVGRVPGVNLPVSYLGRGGGKLPTIGFKEGGGGGKERFVTVSATNGQYPSTSKARAPVGSPAKGSILIDATTTPKALSAGS